jgi:hypothetical protein
MGASGEFALGDRDEAVADEPTKLLFKLTTKLIFCAQQLLRY